MEIQHRKRSCYCLHCREYGDVEGECENQSHVPDWKCHVLEPCAGRTEYETRGRHEETLQVLARSVVAGDVVALEHTDKEFQHYDYFWHMVIVFK